MMPSSEWLSDLDVEEESLEALGGRWSILLDLYIEFQGAVGAYALFAVLLPGLIVASVFFGWGWGASKPGLMLLVALISFTVLVTISLYSWIWYRCVRRRYRRVKELMDLKSELED